LALHPEFVNEITGQAGAEELLDEEEVELLDELDDWQRTTNTVFALATSVHVPPAAHLIPRKYCSLQRRNLVSPG